MKQAAHEVSALDAAVAMVEVLVGTYVAHGERLGRCHKHAMQSIQLLASTSKRFDAAVDLFFDLLERFCARGRDHSKFDLRVTILPGDTTGRIMQNYDQTLVKLISKHWSKNGPDGGWNLAKPLERIKALGLQYEARDNTTLARVSRFGRSRLPVGLFCESQRMLRSIKKGRAGLLRMRVVGYPHWQQELADWMRAKSLPCVRQRNARKALAEYDELREVQCARRQSADPSRLVSQKNAEIDDLRNQVRILVTVLDRSQSEANLGRFADLRRPTTSRTVWSKSDLPDLESDRSSTFKDDSEPLPDERSTRFMRIYHAL